MHSCTCWFYSSNYFHIYHFDSKYFCHYIRLRNEFNLQYTYFFYYRTIILIIVCMISFLKNYLSTCLFIIFAATLYQNNDFHRNFFQGNLQLNFLDISLEITTVLWAVFYAYFILLIPYYLVYTSESKWRIILQYLWKVAKGNPKQTDKEQTALLAWIVKIFFAPLMITWLTQHIFNMINNLHDSYQNIALLSTDFLIFFNNHFFWTAFTLILFIDVFFFTLWYLLEAPFLKNTIRSVEPTIIGWGVCIFCYPPFNTHVTNLIGWFSSDFPTFWNPFVHVTLNIVLLILMAIYSRASFALWFKASNLTNRWIVTHGPYKYIRHPAYVCKNIAWLIGWLPIMYIALTNNQIGILSVLLGLFGWAGIYYLRAMTEENHLSSDDEYIAYKKQVKWKFIPKVW